MIPGTLEFVAHVAPVSANKLYAPRRQGGLCKTATYRMFREAVALFTRQALNRQRGGKALVGDVEVTLRIYRANPRMDADNVVKPTLDALADGGAVANDNQFAVQHLYRCLDPERPRIEVKLEPIPVCVARITGVTE